jgi:hypothetical protein
MSKSSGKRLFREPQARRNAIACKCFDYVDGRKTGQGESIALDVASVGAAGTICSMKAAKSGVYSKEIGRDL